MFKAFLKKVEETTNLFEASLKIKDTKPLDNIIKEIPPIPESIKNIDLSSLKPAGPPTNYYKENIDLHPGSIFLKKYQEKLSELHSNNVIIAKKAEAVDRKLPTLLREATNHHDAWRRMQMELARLPELSANVSNIRNQIDFVLVKFDELEMLLTAQVEQYHAAELAKHKDKLFNDGLKYQAQKQKELASLEEELATSKARFERDKANREKEQARLQRLEQEQQRRKKEEEDLRERRRKQEQEIKEKKQKEEEEKKEQEKLRAAFGNAFQQQVDEFKKSGVVGPSPKQEEPTAPIETIVPEENPQALEEFFQDLVNSNDKLKKESVGEEEQVEKNPLVKSDETIEEMRKEEGEEKEEKKEEKGTVEKTEEKNPIVKSDETIEETKKEEREEKEEKKEEKEKEVAGEVEKTEEKVAEGEMGETKEEKSAPTS